MELMIEARGLVKSYRDVEALKGLDVEVPTGTVLAMLGPNGAGKTTAVSILATLIKPNAGTASVAGIDVFAKPQEVRKKIGLSGQFAAVDEHLTGFENLDMVGRLYKLGKVNSRNRARELLEQFGLNHASDRPVKTYSGGMRRRLDVAGALIAEPPVLFLDEPTTGLDPRSRTELWRVIRDLVSRGTTLLLTTQYLEEADHLANEIMVIDSGQAIAQGTSDDLKSMVGGERIEVTVGAADQIGIASQILKGVADGELQIDDVSRTIVAPVKGGAPALREVLRGLESTDVELRDVGLRRPTLDDVFLTLTGKAAESEEEAETEEENV